MRTAFRDQEVLSCWTTQNGLCLKLCRIFRKWEPCTAHGVVWPWKQWPQRVGRAAAELLRTVFLIASCMLWKQSRRRAEGQRTRGGRLVSTPDLEPGCGFRVNHRFLGSPALARTWSQSWCPPRPGLTGLLSTQFLLKCPAAPPSVLPG